MLYTIYVMAQPFHLSDVAMATYNKYKYIVGCIHAFSHAYACVYTCTHIRTHAHKHAHTNTCIQTTCTSLACYSLLPAWRDNSVSTHISRQAGSRGLVLDYYHTPVASSPGRVYTLLCFNCMLLCRGWTGTIDGTVAVTFAARSFV